MKWQGESRAARLPLKPFSLLLAGIFAVPILSFVPAAAQTTSPPSGQSPAGQPTPGSSGQPAPSGPSGAPATAPSVPLGPDGRPYVAPRPPGPSQTRIPGAFDMSVIALDAPRLSFSSAVTLREEYTDNFHLTEHGQVENFRTSLSASLTATLNYPNTQGSLTTTLGGSYDTAPDDQNFSFFPSFTGTLQHTFNPRMKLVVSDTYIREDDPWLSDASGLRGERETFSKNTFIISLNWLIDIVQTQIYYRNSFFVDDAKTMSHIFGANASMPVGALNTVHAGYEFTTRTTTDTDAENDHAMVHRVFGSFSRSLDTFTTAGVSSSFSLILGSDTDSRIWNASVFAAHGVPGGFSLSGSVGVSLFDSDVADYRATFSASIVASYRFANATISAGYFQDFRQTADEGEDFGIVLSRTAFVAFSYAITPFVTASARGQYSRNEPIDGGGSGISPQSVYLAGASISWRALTWLTLSGSYTWRKRDVDQDGSGNPSGANGSDPDRNNQSSIENRATVTLTARF
jgi:hypothetical protein